VPRLSNLSSLLPRLHTFFSPSLINPSVSPHSAWLSFENVALKYHYPVGLLYDLFSGAAPANPDDDVEGVEEVLPWRLVVSYSGFPGEQLMGLDEQGKVVRDCYVNGVKEVSFVSFSTSGFLQFCSVCLFLLVCNVLESICRAMRMYFGLTHNRQM
jgi:autophagy-related protein 5